MIGDVPEILVELLGKLDDIAFGYMEFDGMVIDFSELQYLVDESQKSFGTSVGRSDGSLWWFCTFVVDESVHSTLDDG